MHLRSGIDGGPGGDRSRSAGLSGGGCGGGNKKAKVTPVPIDVSMDTRYYVSRTHAHGIMFQHIILQCLAALIECICGGFDQGDWRALPGKWRGKVPWNHFQGQGRSHMKPVSALADYGMAMEQLFGREGQPPLEFHGQIPGERMAPLPRPPGAVPQRA